MKTNRLFKLKPFPILLFLSTGLALGADGFFRKTKSAIDQHSRSVETGTLFLDVDSAKVLFSSNAANLFCPASLTKILTTAAYLSAVSKGLSYETIFYTDARELGPVLKGNLYVKGDGDPLITSERLWTIAADWQHMGIKEITGDLLIDHSLFDGPGRDESRKDGTLSSENAYDAPITGFSVNFNTVALAIYPGLSSTQPPAVALYPYDLESFRIEARVTPSSLTKLSIERRSDPSQKANLVQVSGQIKRDSPLLKKYRSLSDAGTESGEIFKSFLEAAGIKLRGTVKSTKFDPVSLKSFYTLGSPQAREVVAAINRYSNNFVADMVTNKLGTLSRKKSAPKSTLEDGARYLNQFLVAEVGAPGEQNLVNGSGLAPENRLSPKQIVSVLNYAYQNWSLWPEFLSSLPVPGQEGSLEKRFYTNETKNVAGQVRAKTGSLSQPLLVSGLAGYLKLNKGRTIAFAIIQNSRPGIKTEVSGQNLRDNQDKILAHFLHEANAHYGKVENQ